MVVRSDILHVSVALRSKGGNGLLGAQQEHNAADITATLEDISPNALREIIAGLENNPEFQGFVSNASIMLPNIQKLQQRRPGILIEEVFANARCSDEEKLIKAQQLLRRDLDDAEQTLILEVDHMFPDVDIFCLTQQQATAKAFKLRKLFSLQEISLLMDYGICGGLRNFKAPVAPYLLVAHIGTLASLWTNNEVQRGWYPVVYAVALLLESRAGSTTNLKYLIAGAMEGGVTGRLFGIVYGVYLMYYHGCDLSETDRDSIIATIKNMPVGMHIGMIAEVIEALLIPKTRTVSGSRTIADNDGAI